MIQRENYSLKSHNTFGVNSIAHNYIEFHNREETENFFNSNHFNPEDVLILGGGSNILFVSDVSGYVMGYKSTRHMRIKDDSDHVWISGDAGMVWNDFVSYTLNMGYQGLENLTLIPGTIGAAPVQNIGAYGVELSHFLQSVEIIEIETGRTRIMNNQDCRFGYRDSIFKRDLKGKAIILSVTFRLNKHPEFNISYGTLKEKIHEKGIKTITAAAISSLVTEIRESKLPDPAVIGNAGSIFKNPVISDSEFLKLSEEHKDIPFYPLPGKQKKIPAAWFIEECGWKGYRKGNVGVYDKQPLVVVNTGNATGHEIYNLILQIKASVFRKFKIDLEIEINII